MVLYFILPCFRSHDSSTVYRDAAVVKCRVCINGSVTVDFENMSSDSLKLPLTLRNLWVHFIQVVSCIFYSDLATMFYSDLATILCPGRMVSWTLGLKCCIVRYMHPSKWKMFSIVHPVLPRCLMPANPVYNIFELY